jgi:DNA-binding GntR family transcriptional regulator
MSLLDDESLREAPARRRPGRRAGAHLRYRQVIDMVDGLVAEKGLEPGDLLPTQSELARMAGVSLITVRRALEELENAGRVVCHQGVGTFVAHPRIVAEPGRSGALLGTLAAEEDEPRRVRTQVLDLRAGPPRLTVARALHIGQADKVWQIRRLRIIDGKPMIIEQALVPVALAPDLGRRRRDLEGSLYELLARERGLIDDHEEQYLEVAAPAERQRRLLKLPARAHVVRLRGVSFTADDVPFDCFEQVYPADAFAFYFAGQTAQKLFRATDSSDWGIAPPGRDT